MNCQKCSALCLSRTQIVEPDLPEFGRPCRVLREGSACHGVYHRSLHTMEYANDIYLMLSEGYDKNGCDGVREALRKIKQELQNT